MGAVARTTSASRTRRAPCAPRRARAARARAAGTSPTSAGGRCTARAASRRSGAGAPAPPGARGGGRAAAGGSRLGLPWFWSLEGLLLAGEWERREGSYILAAGVVDVDRRAVQVRRGRPRRVWTAEVLGRPNPRPRRRRGVAVMCATRVAVARSDTDLKHVVKRHLAETRRHLSVSASSTNEC